MKKNPVLYIFVNKSLHMSSGKIGSQTAQAAVGAFLLSNKKLANLWWDQGAHHTTIILEAKNEKNLKNIKQYLADRKFKSFLMVDEGMTEIDPIVSTALAVEIVDRNDDHVYATFSSFKLYSDRIRVVLEVDN